MFRIQGRRSAVIVATVTAVAALTGCGAKTNDSAAPDAAGAAIETSGTTVKVGILHSLSGTMAISEVTVRDAELLAIEEINAAGGVLGKKIEPVVEDGASDWPTFAEKAQKLITQDKVAAVFGGWTSASRKAMLPVFEQNKALLFYPVQYEGLEASPNIFYTGATTNQQIVPGLDYLQGAGQEEALPGRLATTSSRAPPTRSSRRTPTANGMTIVGEEYTPLGHTEYSTIVNKIKAAKPDVSSTPSTATATWPSSSSSRTPASPPTSMPTISVSDRRGGGQRHRRRQYMAGPPGGLELLPDHRHAGEREVRRGLQGEVRRGQA